MKSFRLLSVGLVMMLLASAPSGCHKASPPVYVKVSGKVVDARGKPVPLVALHFFPTEDVESFRVSRIRLDYPLAISNKDGTFTLSMDGGDIDGARVGKYRVFLAGLTKDQKQKVPLKYQDSDESPLDVTIPNHDVSNLILKIE